ncbi:Hypothetical predicted protein [Mytilus galloprovincialis]|uniref:Mab-21-like HhH/H2TH-like domain-containing protein n=1 Tax=Mytilus galloprovincialis TaxID=29158 RepID=A0A8B6GKH2_MYTGA|nr:Hypothetical predicted protein [Mytilus galloprovincialis]
MPVQMSAEMSLSLNFYKYLCQKIGCEEEVKIRRLTCVIDDLGVQKFDNQSGKRTSDVQITSGSKGEGLQLKGSDYDVMFIDNLFKVYESDKNIVPKYDRYIPLIMDIDDTHPCFTQLRLLDNHDLNLNSEETWVNILLGRKASSELYRLYLVEQFSYRCGVASTYIINIHGPCISDLGETHDFAFCLKCEKWISQAQPWIVRLRTTWPSPDLISKIVSCGVLYVPIGYKGSRNENLQWRISFSVAEKILVFSFNHVQLLCYALLKILLKEIVEKDKDLKSLLCSYFLKTLMFWMLEESDPPMWRPNKMIPCFMSCLKRLIYCIDYSTLLHYFIPDYNLFYLRFDEVKKKKMTIVLRNLFEKGIHCFARSETLFDIMRISVNATDSLIARYVFSIYQMTNTVCSHPPRSFIRLHHFLRHSNTKISRNIFFVMLSIAHQCEPQMSQDQLGSNNKHLYNKYKRDQSHLLIGTNSDAVTGWLLLASFYYVHGNYLLSLDIINHALRKCTDEKLYPWQNGLDKNQENLLRLMNQEELSTLSKAFTVRYPKFIKNLISPQELRLSIHEQSYPFHPIIFAHFLSFLCNYHLPEISSCRQSLILLHDTFMQYITSGQCNPFSVSILLICLGICYQIIGETYRASRCFHRASQLDEHNLTSAAVRLSNCNVY